MRIRRNEDPIRELISDLDARGKPSFAWMVRWSAGGQDPVAAAWRTCWCPDAMVDLLQRAHDPSVEHLLAILRVPALWSSTDIERARCDAIRRVVPIPPRLDVLLALPPFLLRLVTPVLHLHVA